MSKLLRHLSNIILILAHEVICLIVDLLSFIVVPIALLFCGEDDTHLPKIFKWWETYDNDINGDVYWHGPEHADGHQKEYWWRLRWLLRNRSGTFAYTVLGFDKARVKEYKVYGDVMTGNIPGHEGFLYAEAVCDKQTYPCYYYIKRIGNTDRCLRLYFGWKFRQSKSVEQWPKEGLTQFVFHPWFNKFEKINNFEVKE